MNDYSEDKYKHGKKCNKTAKKHIPSVLPSEISL